MENSIFDSKNPLVRLVAICTVISALVGGVFGYYAASLNGNGNTFISNILHPGYADESTAVSNIVKDYSGAVVSIIASKDVPVYQEQQISPYGDLCNDPYFSQFFDCSLTMPQYTQNGTQKQDVAAGTGFIVRSDGLIVTNKHVVDVSGASYTVVTNDGKKYPAKVLARDNVQDIAIVQITATNLPTVKLGDSGNLQIGQSVVAIGNALGQFSNTVSKGIVSGLARTITASEGNNSSEQLDQVIQTDAAINPGNSGGPLINLNGEVIGINTAIASGAQNIGFALPINRAKKDIEDIEKTGKITYPFLGVQYELISPDLQQQNHLALDHGAWVTKGPNGPAVVAGSPAAKAGIQENDIITVVDDRTIDQTHSLADIIQTHHVGDNLSITLNRAGKYMTVQVTLVEKP